MTLFPIARKANPPSCVAVSGASGFIGGRLVELLRDEPSIKEVRAFSRRTDPKKQVTAIRLNDDASLKAALAGCHAMVHCAFDFNDMDSNLKIARVIGRACAAAKIRLVHISTAAIYEPLPSGDLDERFPTHPTDSYKKVKIAIEDELLHCVTHFGLDLVILQPTIVYGPAGRAWTDSPVRELLISGVVLPDNGTGLCNAVFVDDVCRAAINALNAEILSGERFLVNGPAPVEWREFMGAYDRMIGGQGLKILSNDRRSGETPPPERAGLSRHGRSVAAAMVKTILRPAKRLLMGNLDAQARSNINMAMRRVRGALGRNVAQPPNGAKLALYSARCSIRSDKARKFLNYIPEFDLAQGMAITQDYVKRAYAAEIERNAKKSPLLVI